MSEHKGCLPEKWLRSLLQTWNSLQSVGSGKNPGCRQRKAPACSDPSQPWVAPACVVQEALLQTMLGDTSEQLTFAMVLRTWSPMLAQTTNLSQPSQYGPDALHVPASAARVPLLFVGGDAGWLCAYTYGRGSHCCPIYLRGEPMYMEVLQIRHSCDKFIQNIMGEPA
jgi:hypothetical protein